ncbi:hypothetical protein V0M98_33515 (plasmid) [Pseudomonas silesiensis]|uniref:hypothetical protein n=1 Tax=Pseudomonas silesiensis TaxID=1853130 RepID=UPI0030D42DD2
MEITPEAAFEKGLSVGKEGRAQGDMSITACRHACPWPKDDILRRAYIRGWKVGTGRVNPEETPKIISTDDRK